MTRLASGGPELVIAAVVATLGLLQALESPAGAPASETLTAMVLALLTAGIVAISRRRPGLSLALVWAMAAVHLLGGFPVVFVEISFLVVAFTTARWGSTWVATAGGLSIVGAGLLAVLQALTYRYAVLDLVPPGLAPLLPRFTGIGDLAYVAAPFLGMLLLTVPWLVGLALRFSDRAKESQVGQQQAEHETERARRESEQAHEIARLRDDQARLARDVHDVVGHSLAVILAQAESAQYAADDDTEKLKATMATIATSARSSLQDVRHVLTAAADFSDQESAPTPTRALDTLIEGVRSGGHEVISREDGTPQPLPPDLEVVAYRVLQEMLTNAIRHGNRQEPVRVERHWPDGAWSGELRLEVCNSVGPDEGGEGQGLEGMRRRLETCGGRLDVRRREGERPEDPATFTATAWVPVRSAAP